jgi:rSAM/selenodomain-associated transferase 2
MISVIIPTLNEAGLLPLTLQRIQQNAAPHEVLVVDAGSVDGTAALGKSAGCRVLESSQRQRAVQMNLGARQAKGNILLFLHGDTWIGSNALGQIETALDDTRVLGGGFTRRFDGPSSLLNLTCLLAEYRSRWLGWFLGDQGIFVRRSAFESLGGFRDVQLFEDLDFSRRLARLGRTAALKPPVISSARRFVERGILATTLTDFWLTLRYLCGADPNRLAAGLRRKSQSLTNRAGVGTSNP